MKGSADMTKSVPQALRDLGELYEERNKTYGDNYRFFGKMMLGMFPHGLVLKSEEDFNRFGVFVQAASKMTRYAQNFKRGGHSDSCDDISVYIQMLNELDSEIREKRLKETY